MTDRVVIGPATLILGDCREHRDAFPGAAALIADPPYGIGHKTAMGDVARRSGVRLTNYKNYPPIAGDDRPFDPRPWLGFPKVVLWGGHHFYDRLPAGGSWLVWDKRVGQVPERAQADGEAAWINWRQPLRMFRLLWDGLCVGSAARWEVTAGSQRLHPAQKPVALMAWCIGQCRLPPGALIADPFMGVGPVGIAAVAAGLRYVGCEIDPLYFDRACRRIEDAARQGVLALAAGASA